MYSYYLSIGNVYSIKIHELNELKDVYSIFSVDESYGEEYYR